MESDRLKAWEHIERVTRRNRISHAHKKAELTGSVVSGPEDYSQTALTALWEWLGDPRHLKIYRELAARGDDHVARWFTDYVKGRMSDLKDKERAAHRDCRRTKHASHHVHKSVGSVGSRSNTYLEIAALQSGATRAPSDMRRAVEGSYEDVAILTAVLNAPAAERAKWLRTAIRTGDAEIVPASGSLGESKLLLRHDGCDASRVHQKITWIGAPTKKPFDTQRGSCRCEILDDDLVLLFRDLTVRVNRDDLKGRFVQRYVKPVLGAFALKPLARYLGWPDVRLRKAWSRLREKYGQS